MNQRLTELYRSCRTKEALASQDAYSSADVLIGTEVAKFAELIVGECADIIGKVPNGYRDYRNQIEDAMRNDCIQAIQEHFGVDA